MRSLLTLLFIVLTTSQSYSLGLDDKLPDSTLGTIMREWFVALNSGDKNRIRKFVESRFSENAFRYQQSADEYTALFTKLYEQSGGLEIVSVQPLQPPQPLSIIVKSRRGDRYAVVTCGLDSNEQEKLAGLGIDKTDSPVAPNLKSLTRQMSEKEMMSSITSYLDARTASGDFSGVVMIAKDDKVLLKRAYGYADREAKIRNTVDTTFHIASIGKIFTAVAIGQLVRAGKLSFDDTIAKVLPDYPNRDVAQKITIQQLLTHSAGLGTFFESPGFVKGKSYRNSTEEIEVYKDEKLFFEPGTSWRYSNAGYSLLGAVIERISGKSYLDYIRENIFEPLGMQDTYANGSGKPAAHSSVFYTQLPADPFGLEPFIGDRRLAADQAHAFGGGFSSVADMLKFLRAYRTGKLLGPELTLKMATGQVKQDPAGHRLYGYAISQFTSNGETVRGHTGGSRSEYEILWDSGYTIMIMTNAIPPTVQPVTAEIVDLITRQNKLRSNSATAGLKSANKR